jgi:hypothetical protein
LTTRMVVAVCGLAAEALLLRRFDFGEFPLPRDHRCGSK